MFICGQCGKPTKAGQPMTRRIVETREVEYKHEGKVVGKGHETVREVGVGPCCGGKNSRDEVGVK